MNSMKLFNKINLKYLKENIKKSKGILAFCLGVIPLINILILIIVASSLKNNIEILDFNSVSIVTYIGLFIIPIVLAVSLFGFIFKSKSVDFVLSKPISRGTIYLTNIFGGILIITIFMLLNSLIYILFGLIFSNLIIPFSLIFDYFILFLVSYIFIFIVSSLAISLAGNLMGSIVLILIIICLNPFIKGVNIYFYEMHQNDFYLKCASDNCKPEKYNCYDDACLSHLEKNEYKIDSVKNHNAIFTAPFYSINNLNDNNVSLYSTSSIIKMLILSFAYTIIGYYLFKKRKMENNETSFKNPKLHYFIKIITILPISFICYLIIKETNELGFIINIAIILIYGVIYDLITRKEIYKFLKSSAISLAALSVFLGLYGLYDIKLNNNTIVIKDIKEVNFGNLIISKDKKYEAFGEVIKGEDLINNIIKETIDLNAEIKGSEHLQVKTKNNHSYTIYIRYDSKTDNILKELKRLNNLSYFKNYAYDNIKYTGMYIKPTKKLKELIKNTMTNITEYNYNETNFLLEVATYKNHQYETFYIMPNINKELDKYVMNERNKQAVNFLENRDVEFSANESIPLFNYVISKNLTKFLDYLKNNNMEVTNDTLIIYAYDYYGMNILIGNRSSFKKEYTKWEESLASDEYYQNLLKSYDPNIQEDYLEEDYEY